MGGDRLAALIETQRPHLALWIPVFFALGIALYFAVPAEPEGWMLAALAFVLAVGFATLFRVGPVARALLLAAVLPGLGFGVAALRSRVVAAPVLAHEMTVNVEGRIVGLDRSASDRPRVLLDRVVIHGLPPERTPARVRISLDPSTAGRPAAARAAAARAGAAVAAGGAVGAGRLRLSPAGVVRADRGGRLCPDADGGGLRARSRRAAAASVPGADGGLGAYPAGGAGAGRRVHLGDPDRRPLGDGPGGRGGAPGVEPLSHRLDLGPAHDDAGGGGLRHDPLRAGAGPAAGAGTGR